MFIVTVGFKINVHREFHQHSLQQTGIQDNTIIVLHSSSIGRRFKNSNWALTQQDQHSLEQCLLLMLTYSGLLATVILLTCHHHTRREAYTILVAISSDRDVLATCAQLPQHDGVQQASTATTAIVVLLSRSSSLDRARPLQTDAPSLHMHEFPSRRTYDIDVACICDVPFQVS